jgi:hypothetical protein
MALRGTKFHGTEQFTDISHFYVYFQIHTYRTPEFLYRLQCERYPKTFRSQLIAHNLHSLSGTVAAAFAVFSIVGAALTHLSKLNGYHLYVDVIDDPKMSAGLSLRICQGGVLPLQVVDWFE